MSSSASRNLRKKIRRPKTDEEFFEGITPKKHARDASLTDKAVSSSSSSSEDEQDHSSSPSNQKTQRYKGPVVQYNPNLPPAPFISSDSRAGRSGQQDKQTSSDEEKSLESPSQHRQALAQGDNLRAMTSSKSQNRKRIQCARDKMTGSKIGPIPDWLLPAGLKDREKAEVAQWDGAVNTHWMDMVDMMTSDEEYDDDGDEMDEVPSWSDIADAQKLDLLDTLGEMIEIGHDGEDEDHYIERLMRRLRLTRPEREDAKSLILARQARKAEESSALRNMQQGMRERLMASPAGRKISAQEHEGLIDQHLGHLIQTDDFNISTRKEVEVARRYWKACGLDPRSLEGGWEVQDVVTRDGKDHRPSKSQGSRKSNVPVSLASRPNNTQESFQPPMNRSPAVSNSICKQHQTHQQSALPINGFPIGLRGGAISHAHTMNSRSSTGPKVSRPAPVLEGKTISDYIQTRYQPDYDTFMGHPYVLSDQTPSMLPMKVSQVDHLNASFRQAQSHVEVQVVHQARTNLAQPSQPQHGSPLGNDLNGEGSRTVQQYHLSHAHSSVTLPTPSPTPPDLERMHDTRLQNKGVTPGGGSDRMITADGQANQTPQRLRAACHACHQAKRKCSGGTPCNICQHLGTHCSYAVAGRIDRLKGIQSNRSLPQISQQGNENNNANLSSIKGTGTGSTIRQELLPSYHSASAAIPSVQISSQAQTPSSFRPVAGAQFPPQKRLLDVSGAQCHSASNVLNRGASVENLGNGLNEPKAQMTGNEHGVKRQRGRTKDGST